jgi:uncharacterized protein YgbK (DUF1537 family)
MYCLKEKFLFSVKQKLRNCDKKESVAVIGIVADDTTGANDIGIMFVNKGLTAKILTFDPEMTIVPDTDVVIIDTDSRLDSGAASYEKVYHATKLLMAMGCSLFHKKTCSVFRGNIGADFDAMLDALETPFTVISLAFPKNGRQTEHGIHRVHGRLLEESEFAADPVHPMKSSNLVEILRSQTNRSVDRIDIEVVRQGAPALRAAIREKRKQCSYCIIDTISQEDLRIVAEATHDENVLAGSSAIAEELPAFWPTTAHCPITLPREITAAGKNVLIVAGSLTPQTKEQTQAVIDAGIPSIIIDSRHIFDSTRREQIIASAVESANIHITQQKDLLIMAANDPAIIDETKEIGQQAGLDRLQTSKAVSATLGAITEQLICQTSTRRLIIAGGDTAGTVCRTLGIRGNYVLREIETGVPSGLTVNCDLLIVLKSGSFGGPQFLLKAATHLKELV